MTTESYEQARSKMAQLLGNLVIKSREEDLATLQGIMDELIEDFSLLEIVQAACDADKLKLAGMKAGYR